VCFYKSIAFNRARVAAYSYAAVVQQLIERHPAVESVSKKSILSRFFGGGV